MENLITYLQVFLVGGFICLLGQILIIKTKITSARILVLFLSIGIVLEAFNLFEPIKEFGKAGATIPIVGFGASLAKGAIEAAEKAPLGIFTGGLTATSAGIAAAIIFSYLAALIFNSKTK